ncbi:GBP6, partial [Symbiodinium sp. KB8]
ARRGVSNYGATSDAGDLPDLTEQLKASGIYEEYLAYRDRYQEWRKGGALGAQGELTAEALEQQSVVDRGDPYRFEYWYPTASIFRMRFTLAYWISVMFLLGSIFFCLGSANKLLEAYGGRIVQVWPNLLGGVAYTVGCYLSYVQLINMPTRKAESLRLLCADWNKVSERVDVPSTIGTVAFLAGAILFQIACVADFADVPTHADLWIGLPNFIGSLLFTVGGVCEILLNRTGGDSNAGDDIAWLASWFTLVGSVCFVASAGSALYAPHWHHTLLIVPMGYFMGALLFGITAILLLLLWEANDFGLTLLNQLNHAIRAESVSAQAPLPQREPSRRSSGEQTKDSPKMSVRDVTFIAIYCWFIATALVACVVKDQWYKQGFYRSGLLLWTGLGMQVFVVIV